MTEDKVLRLLAQHPEGLTGLRISIGIGLVLS